MKNDLILIGGGGHCKSVVGIIEATGLWNIKGILDVAAMVGKKVLGYSVIGTDSCIPALVSQGSSFVITVGQIRNCKAREKLFAIVKSAGGNLPVIASPSAYVAKHSLVGESTVIMHNAFVNEEAVIGCNCILNTSSIIEHNVQIGDLCHISTAAVLNGDVKVGRGCFIGSGAVITEGVSIADDVVVGAGTVVINDILEQGIFVGVPARKKQ